MTLYSINQFSEITGLNKILIRTWENRYNFLNPIRTDTNIRVYDDIMLNKGIKYAILVQSGYKISKLIKYTDENINNLIEKALEEKKDTHTVYNIYISKFIESALSFNQKQFNQTYSVCIKELGIMEFYKTILIPTMSKISVLYLNSKITSANEHFLSENIRVKICNEIENTQHKVKDNNEWVLFLPENEYHDIGLLFSHFILKKYHQKVIYLGQNTTRESLLQLKNKDVKFLFFLNKKSPKEFNEKLFTFLNDHFAESNIYLVEKEQLERKNYTNIKNISSIDSFINLLEKEEN